MSFALLDVGQRPCLYGHPLEIQPDYVTSRFRAGRCGNHHLDFLCPLVNVPATLKINFLLTL